MALKPLNSVGGFSVGEVPANVILANADITANNATFQGNVAVSNATPAWGVLTDNLYYSNGTPWDFQQAAGSNGEIQFNMGDDFDASPNLTFDSTTSNFKVTGNANITGTLSAGAIEVDEIFNGNSNVAIPVANGNVNISVAGNANVLVVSGTGVDVAGYIDATGTITGANLALDDGNIVSLGTSGLYLNPANATAGIVLQSNTTPNSNVAYNLGSTSKVFANIYGNNVIVSANLDSGNANLGNLAVANYVNVNNNLNVTENIFAGNIQVNVAANISNLAVANFVTSNLTPTSDDQYSLGTTLKRWKDINIAGNANIAVANVSGNLSAGNVNFGNLLTGNYANFANDIQVIGNIANANNVSITNSLQGNTANFSGNLTSLNANLGNLAEANYVNVAYNVDINGSLDATNANFVGNIAISNSNPAFGLLTDNLYYANGQPWDLQEAAGSNNEIQFNTNDNFDASANFTFNPATDTLTVTGNANVTNSINTPNIVGTGGANLNELTITANGYSTVFDETGNVTFPSDIIANTVYANVSGNITTTAANKTVLFSDNGVISGGSGFTFDKLSNLVSMTGNVELGLAGDNQLVNLSNTSLEIRGGWDAATGTGVNIVAGDYNNASNWGKLAILGNYSGNAVGFAEANAFVFTNPGYGSGNIVKVDVLNNAASNTTTGAIQVAGGIGVTGDSYFGANLSVTGNIANANNISVTNALNANTGNFSGNINSLNANLGNLVDANFIRTDQLFNGNSNISITANGNILFSVEGLANVHTFSNAGINVVGYVQANGIGSFGGVETVSVTSNVGNLTLYANTSGDNYVELRPSGNGQVDTGNFRIQNLGTPVYGADATTKDYVDNAIAGLTWKQAAELLANTNVSLTGTSGTLVIDGHPALTPTENGYRLVLINQTTTTEDGIYVYNDTGNGSYSITRSSDADTYQELEGAAIFILEGNVYANTGWTQTNHYLTSFANQMWVQFAGGGAYTGANGISVVGTVISANTDGITTEIAGGNIVVKANAQFTTPNIGAATGTSLDLTGNLLANNVNSNNLITTTDLQASGNIIAANISANANLVVNNATVNLELSGNTANFSGNVIVPNLTVNTTLSGNVANFTGNLTAANANLGNLATANYFTGILVNGTSNAGIDGLNGNFNVSVGGNANVLQVTSSNANVTGGLNVTGNISANNFTSNTVTANTQVDIGTTQIIYGNVTTNSITANQQIATVAISGVTGVEWLVKGYDSSGSKYSMAIVTAVTDGANADYSTFGTVNLGGSTGSLAVNVVGSNLELQVTPASTNTTVWVTQFRTI